jgi:hypothetical protein
MDFLAKSGSLKSLKNMCDMDNPDNLDTNYSQIGFTYGQQVEEELTQLREMLSEKD